MDIKPTFSKNLKEIRKKNGITQKNLADSCGVKQSVISSYENGSSTPNLEVAADIAKTLGVSLDWLCGFDGNPQPVTALQWFSFTDKLINDPPEIEHEPIVRFRVDPGENVAAAVEFYGEDMQKFFTAYAALMSTKGKMSDSVYENLIKTMFQCYSDFFEPGFAKYTRGAEPPANPPILR